MNLKSIATSIFPFAKTISTALAGPAGPIVNMALTAAGKALGVEPTQGAVAQALQNDPEAATKMREAENAFSLRMAELDVDVFSLEAKEKQSARNMAKVNMWPQIVLSTVFVTGYFGLVAMLVGQYWHIPTDEQGGQLIAGLILVLTTGVTGILGFWFGSSFGSKHKVSRNG